MTTVTLAQTDDDLRGMLALQQQNWVGNVAADVQATQGFVTNRYTLDEMRLMHAHGPSVVAKDASNRIVAYAITAVPAVRPHVRELAGLFALIDTITYDGQPLRTPSYYVMGQVCVAEAYRGQGLFDALYAHHRAVYAERFRRLITEVSPRNLRSLRAHERVGFRPVHTHRDPLTAEDWLVVAWDWHRD